MPGTALSLRALQNGTAKVRAWPRSCSVTAGEARLLQQRMAIRGIQ
jgi:hypothetical protein